MTLEEHFVIGGLGGAISEIKSRNNYSGRHISIGIEDGYVKTGDYNYALSEAGLLKEKISYTLPSVLSLAAAAVLCGMRGYPVDGMPAVDDGLRVDYVDSVPVHKTTT